MVSCVVNAIQYLKISVSSGMKTHTVFSRFAKCPLETVKCGKLGLTNLCLQRHLLRIQEWLWFPVEHTFSGKSCNV